MNNGATARPLGASAAWLDETERKALTHVQERAPTASQDRMQEEVIVKGDGGASVSGSAIGADVGASASTALGMPGVPAPATQMRLCPLKSRRMEAAAQQLLQHMRKRVGKR